ncbi:hypothetical protein GS534_02970 [Rhodococcus hoagii]|nr:hypothetical protein [Prescottella equi]
MSSADALRRQIARAGRQNTEEPVSSRVLDEIHRRFKPRGEMIRALEGKPSRKPADLMTAYMQTLPQPKPEAEAGPDPLALNSAALLTRAIGGAAGTVNSPGAVSTAALLRHEIARRDFAG